MTYEFITPSDPITFKTENEKVAFFCCLILGGGKAGMRREDGEGCESPMVFLSPDPMPAIEQYLGCSLAEFDEPNISEIIDCFQSFAYGSLSERKKYDATVSNISNPEVLKAFKKEHENKNRSSMSKWVQAAWAYADGFDKKREKLLADSN